MMSSILAKGRKVMNEVEQDNIRDDYNEVGRLHLQAKELDRIRALANTASAIMQRSIEVRLFASSLEAQHIEGDDLMSVAQVFQDAADSVKTAADSVKSSVDSAIARLSDNPTPAQISAVVDTLRGASTELAGVSTSADAINPSVPATGVVTDPAGTGGVVEAPVP
jgi:hypothetical protein